MSNDMNEFKRLVALVADGNRLTLDQARVAFDIMMTGNATPAQMGALLIALRVRGETIEEITGGAMEMRSKAVTVDAPEGAIDTCGTGGDATGTLNISTATSLVVAACGVPVAKHGNRAQSSKSGAADVLAALGVNIDAPMPLVRKSLWEANVCFLMAPRHHGAMRHVAGTRVELGTRTIFNLLGPLANPAGVKRQLLGVFAKRWVEPMAQVLANLGSTRVWAVHGADGIDEISITGPTHVAELRDGRVRSFEIAPSDAGLPTARLDQIKGADAEFNARAVRDLLDGEKGAYRNIVLINAAAALIVAERAVDLKDGVAQAAVAIDSGQARKTLATLVAITHEASPA